MVAATPTADPIPRSPGRWDARGIVLPIVAVLATELLFRFGGIRSDSLAPPSEVVAALWGGLADGEILEASRQTLIAALGGLVLGGTIGLILGLACGLFWRIDTLLDVTTEALRPIPSVTLIPVMILIFGFGYRLEIACIAFSCTWTVFILSRTAVRGVDRGLLEVGRVLCFGPVARAYKLVLPAALPQLFVAFRLAAGLALIVAVTCEIAANPIGLGAQMMVASNSLHPALTLADLVWIGIIGWGLNQGLIAAQNRLFGRAARTGAPR